MKEAMDCINKVPEEYRESLVAVHQNMMAARSRGVVSISVLEGLIDFLRDFDPKVVARGLTNYLRHPDTFSKHPESKIRMQVEESYMKSRTSVVSETPVRKDSKKVLDLDDASDMMYGIPFMELSIRQVEKLIEDQKRRETS
jgi:hypothetical protein